ncbi:hypothetical protein Trydic_g14485 [Trypoxylus dichotomus]
MIPLTGVVLIALAISASCYDAGLSRERQTYYENIKPPGLEMTAIRLIMKLALLVEVIVMVEVVVEYWE